MSTRSILALMLSPLVLTAVLAAPDKPIAPLIDPPPHVSTDKTVKYDYDIVYVRAPRFGDKVVKRAYTEIAAPHVMEPGADLMLLRPDGTEEVLVAGGKGSVTDPFVSLDGEWVFYALFHDLSQRSMWEPNRGGSDIYKLHLKSRKIVRLTHQELTPNTGVGKWSADPRKPKQGETGYSHGTLNLGPCPLPGGRLVFTSSRDAFAAPKHACPMLQLFVMDDDGRNVECIGHLNLGTALHPVVLMDGRVIFSSMENQAQRNGILWGLWSIHPDGTNWGPVVSAFDLGWAPNAFHFQSQLSDGSIIAQLYYNQNNSGFGSFFKLPAATDEGYPQFGPAHLGKMNEKMKWRGGGYSMPFEPRGMEVYSRFTHGVEGPSPKLDPKDAMSPHTGKVTHPSGAPDNHLLCIWSPGPVNHQYSYLPQYDGGICLIKSGGADDPREMRLIKNDPNYNEQFPRAVVPYKRIYGIDAPKPLAALRNDGKLSPHLPEGTPFGLVGTSSLYKRESYPNGKVPEGKVTATYAGGNDPWKGLDPFTSHGNGPSRNWNNQGSDVGMYDNDDIHAIRIVTMEPTSYATKNKFFNHAHERLRILGEIPVRKFAVSRDAQRSAAQPLDPDGNPDTSFLAKIPADVGFTFQTLDKDGLMLNMAQTWHQVRPGEIRNDCGGCHAHSQKPTDFAKTSAAKAEYKVFDLTSQTPLLVAKDKDESKRQWDVKDETGLRFASRALDVEYHRDIKPILARSCVACHTAKEGKEPPGKLNLDADDEKLNVEYRGAFPGTYYRLALDGAGKFGHPSLWGTGGYGTNQASRYVRKWQARRSLLVWKILGKRTDGWTNDDHPTETTPGDIKTLTFKGKALPDSYNNKARADLDYTGSAMPPPEAVKAGKVKPLTDEDRRTIYRWIDLGCPIDRDIEQAEPSRRAEGWYADDKRPTLTMPIPGPGKNAELSRILVGMHDYYTGIDAASFSVTADFAIDGIAAGDNLATHFKDKSPGVRELKLAMPLTELKRGTLTVAVKDRQGNVTRIERTISIGK